MNNKDLIPKTPHSFFGIVLSFMVAILIGAVIFESNAVSNIRSQLMHPVLGIALGIVFIYIIFNFTGKYTRIPLIGVQVDTGVFAYIIILTIILFTLS